jgi:peptide/nickel transport system ATP-binding protein
MNVILTVENLKKHFEVPGGNLHAVDGISFSIKKGETFGVVGESGCGKSTLGRTIIHIHQPTSGRIYFENEDITFISGRQCRDLLRRMQFIFQDPYSSLNPRMTVIDIIMEPLLIDGMKKKDARQRASNLMEMVGLSKAFETSYPHELDGGRRQRIGIARALALEPKLIICDEPVSALDVSIQAQILNLLLELQEELKLTYIFITHDLSVVKHISDRVMVMYLGNMVELAETKELFRNPLHPYTKALLSAVPSINIDEKQKREILHGEIASPINPMPGCRFAARCKHVTEICKTDDPKLMEVKAGHFVACHNI